jgi:hypothetical protein
MYASLMKFPPAGGAVWFGKGKLALGCVGAVTDGSVRDMAEVKEAGFHFFASCVSVSPCLCPSGGD